nr:MAG TPA: hypothetical protein [Caudoviricetes sp.]
MNTSMGTSSARGRRQNNLYLITHDRKTKTTIQKWKDRTQRLLRIFYHFLQNKKKNYQSKNL